MTVKYQEIWQEAVAAGTAAGESAIPAPMVVGESTSVFGSEIDFSKPTYYVSEGVCGFASIHFKGNTAFGRWAKKSGLARNGYGGGLYVWVREFGQSLTRKEAYASAFAEVLRKNGIEVWIDSRLD